MRITDEDVCGAAVLQSQKSALEFLKDCMTYDGLGAIASLLTRGGGSHNLTETEKKILQQEIYMQTQALYIGLAPIWLNRGRTLPCVETEDIMQIFSLGEEGLWSATEVYDALAAANGLWGTMISVYKDEFSDDGSSIYVAAIIQAFLNKLEPLEVTTTLFEKEKATSASNVDPDIVQSVDDQLDDIFNNG